MNRKIIVFFGPPGSGKGTQSEYLSQALKLPIIATGELLRQEQNRGTALGKELGGFMDKGKLVPDKLIHELIAKRSKKPDAKNGFILDGHPRDENQLKDLISMIKEGDELIFIEIKVGDREVQNRLGGRRVCDCGATYHLIYNPPKVAGRCDVCGKKLYIRHDDKPDVINDRLKTYHDAANPILKYAAEHFKLISLNGQQPIEAVRRAMFEALKLPD